MKLGTSPSTSLVVPVAVATLLAIAGLAASGSAGAGHDPIPAGDHLMVLPKTAQAQTVAHQVRPRVLAEYDDFSLIEARGAAATELADAGAVVRDDMAEVTTAAGSFDPVEERQELPDDRSGGGTALVQFIGPIKEGWLDRLEGTGVTRVSYLPQNAYLVAGSAVELQRVARLRDRHPELRGVAVVEPEDKVELLPGSSKKVSVSIQTLSGEDGAGTRREISESSKRLTQPWTVGELRTQQVEIDREQIAELAADPHVVAIEPYEPPRLHDERGAQIVAGNLSGSVPSAPGYLAWLASKGFDGSPLGSPSPFVVDISDEGLDAAADTEPSPSPEHQDFHEQGATSNPSRVQYVSNYTADSNGRDCGGHGTNVASIATGYNDSSGSDFEQDGYRYGLGIAPSARLGASKIFRCNNAFTGFSFATITTGAYAAGARISNNSWGSDQAGNYTATSQAFDALVRDARPLLPDNQQLVEVFSNGNAGPSAGSVGAPATAKNVISVGASENVRAGGTDGCGVTDAEANSASDLIDFSSRGPTDDGRIKPDLVAPGTHVTGASPTNASYPLDGDGVCDRRFPSGNLFYSRVSGTSQAAPGVTGAAAMTMDWWQRTEGGGSTLPSPAMTKALLINTASDIAGGSDGAGSNLSSLPNPDQGWGRVSLGRVLDGTQREYRDQLDVFDNSGESWSRAYSVPDSGEPVKLTLTWTDAPGAITGNSFVNDLDLVVTTGSGTYRGNVFSGGVSVPGGPADTRNNVENVFLPAGAEGPVSVEVRATNVAGDGVPNSGDGTDQDFALVASNAQELATPVLDPGEGSVTSTTSGDQDVEPGESFEFDQLLHNAGTDVATGVSAAAAPVSAGLSVPGGPVSYPDINPAASELNSAAFAAELDSGSQCGAPARFALGITTDQGPQTVDAVFQTGTPGPATSFPADDLPKTIASTGTRTVTSAINVGQAGTVRDVNVSIGQLNHTAVGDLKIELIGPDGTTVELTNRLGGTSDDFVGTVFDDEAATSIAAAAAPRTGSFRPALDQLSRFDGRSQQGSWRLRVTDFEEGNGGSLQSWGVANRIAQCPSLGSSPDAEFAIDPTTPVTGQLVKFDSSPSASQATVASREWDLDGDGSFDDATGVTTALLPGTSGTRTVGLRVTDVNGMVDATSKSFAVTDPVSVPPASTPALDATAPRVALLNRKLRIDRRGHAALRLACPAGESSCKGRVDLRRTSTRQRSLPVRFGGAPFEITGGKRVTVLVRVAKRVRVYLRRRSSMRVSVRLRARDVAGNSATVRRTVALRDSR